MKSLAPGRRRSWRLAAFVIIIGGLGLAGWCWAGGLAQFCNSSAARALAARDGDAAAYWLIWSQRAQPGNARAEFLWARLARRQQQYDRVRGHLLRAWQLGYPVDLLEREQWLVKAQEGLLREVEPRLAGLLIDPRSDGAEICEAYVTGYLSMYQTGKARRLLDAWTRDYPGDPLPYVFRGRLHVDAQNWKTAGESFRKALALAPDDPEVAVALADVLVAERDYDQALSWYFKANRKEPRRAPARLGAAQCLNALGRGDEAHAMLKWLVAEQPSNSSALYNLAQMELGAGDYVAARDLLERARKGDLHNAEILYALAAALRRTKEPTAADALAEQAREIAAAKTRIDSLVAKVAAQSDDVPARYEIGTLHLKYGSEREGLMWLKSILQIEPDHAPAREAITEFEQRSARPR